MGQRLTNGPGSAAQGEGDGRGRLVDRGGFLRRGLTSLPQVRGEQVAKEPEDPLSGGHAGRSIGIVPGAAIGGLSIAKRRPVAVRR